MCFASDGKSPSVAHRMCDSELEVQSVTESEGHPEDWEAERPHASAVTWASIQSEYGVPGCCYESDQRFAAYAETSSMETSSYQSAWLSVGKSGSNLQSVVTSTSNVSAPWPRPADCQKRLSDNGHGFAARHFSTCPCHSEVCHDVITSPRSMPELKFIRPLSPNVTTELRMNASQWFHGVEQIAVRSVAFLGPEEPETFLCLVFFENQVKTRRLNLKACTSEKHGCCIDCITSFFRSRIQQGRVFELYCPVGASEGGCNDSCDPACASCEEVERCFLDDRVTYQKYSMFLKKKVDSSLRECPDCQSLCSPRLGVDAKPEPEMQCRSCGSLFCYYHAAAHRHSSCEEYDMRLAAETKRISDLFGAKDCPHCRRQTIKSGGCNHMTCQVCRCDWCWICCEKLTARGPHGEDSVYWHYSDENTESGCQQFVEPGTQHDMEAVRLCRRDRRPGPFMQRLVIPVRFLSVSLLVLTIFLTFGVWLVIYLSASLVANTFCLIARGVSRISWLEQSHRWVEVKTETLVRPTFYFTVAIGSMIFLVPFVGLLLTWGSLSLVLWACLWILGHMPIISGLLPRTTHHHIRFLVFAPVRAVHQFGSLSLASLEHGYQVDT